MTNKIKVEILDTSYVDRMGKVTKGPKLPKYNKPLDSGMDAMAYIEEPKIMAPGECWMCPTGLHFAMPEGYECQVRSRSGITLKNQVVVLNSPGTVN